MSCPRKGCTRESVDELKKSGTLSEDDVKILNRIW